MVFNRRSQITNQKSRLFFPVFILSLLLLLTGCVYLRLLRVKNQIKNFDEHFVLSGDSELVIQLKNPVLSSADVVYLIGAEPLSVTPEKEKEIYFYRFEMIRKQSDHPPPLNGLSLTLEMTEKKLVQIKVPARFMRIFSRRVIEESLRHAGHAKIFTFNKIAQAVIRLTPEADADLPTLEKTRELLGEPLEFMHNDNLQKLIYRYRIVHDKNDVPIIAKLTFDAKGSLLRVFVTWDSASVDAQYVRREIQSNKSEIRNKKNTKKTNFEIENENG